MKLPKASEEQKRAFRELIEPFAATSPAVEVKPMFGQVAAFVNGNMFAGLFGDSLGVKLDAEALAELESAGGAPFGPQERPMGGFLAIPEAADSKRWIGRALDYVGTLPPKAPRTPGLKGSRVRGTDTAPAVDRGTGRRRKPPDTGPGSTKT